MARKPFPPAPAMAPGKKPAPKVAKVAAKAPMGPDPMMAPPMPYKRGGKVKPKKGC